jgi:hypothetical protein
VVEGGGYSLKYTVTSYLSMTGIIYAILRKFGQMSSMIKISKQAFVENNFRWEDGVDWLAILLATGGIIWMELQVTLPWVELTDYMRSYLAASICALWFKLVSWLSVINWQAINLVHVLYQVSRCVFFCAIPLISHTHIIFPCLDFQRNEMDPFLPTYINLCKLPNVLRHALGQ